MKIVMKELDGRTTRLEIQCEVPVPVPASKPRTERRTLIAGSLALMALAARKPGEPDMIRFYVDDTDDEGYPVEGKNRKHYRLRIEEVSG